MKLTHLSALAVLLLTTASASPLSSTKTVATGARSRLSAALPPTITVSPTTVSFPTTLIGGFSYAMVTVSNNGGTPDFITGATPVEGTFFATFGGTCNFSEDALGNNYYLPPFSSCTFQWGFNPKTYGGGKPPWTFTGTGALHFRLGPDIALNFIGLATPH